MKVLLDTNICIHMIKNKPPEVRKRFECLSPGDVALSSITVTELQYDVEKSAAREKNMQAWEHFCYRWIFFFLTLIAAIACGRIRATLERQGTPIGGMDMLIAAQAIALDYALITHNLKEFQSIPSLRCETWID